MNNMDYIFEYYKKYIKKNFDFDTNNCNEKITKTSLAEARIYVENIYDGSCYTCYEKHFYQAISIYTHFDVNIISDDETVQKISAKKNCYNFLLNLGCINA
jgi:hypothetical protein